jgi:hypothetical protein
MGQHVLRNWWRPPAQNHKYYEQYQPDYEQHFGNPAGCPRYASESQYACYNGYDQKYDSVVEHFFTSGWAKLSDFASSLSG